jgi:putative PIN family toxin of toxin-antitoxin system
MYKIVIDSNIWVSFLIGKTLRNLVQYIRSGQVTIITCDEQLQELANAFQKPKLQKYFQADQTSTFFSFLKGVSLIVPIIEIAHCAEIQRMIICWRYQLRQKPITWLREMRICWKCNRLTTRLS